MSLKFILLPVLCLVCIIAFSETVQARNPKSGLNMPYGNTGWSAFLRGGYLHQFKTDIDNGGDFSVDRFFVQGGVRYSPQMRRSVSLAIGYGYDGYDFSGSGSFGALQPWSNINSFRISTPVRWGFDDKWTLFVIPTLRFTAESGADLDDAAQGGGFSGFSYRFSDRLTLGPGIERRMELETQRGRLERALFFDAYGSEAVETAADSLNDYLAATSRLSKERLTKRFSPGYGDLSLEKQGLFYRELELEKLDVTMDDRFILHPNKTITALIGVEG